MVNHGILNYEIQTSEVKVKGVQVLKSVRPNLALKRITLGIIEAL